MADISPEAVDRYLIAQLLDADTVLDEALARNAQAGLPAIDVAPNQGKLLQLLVRIAGARRVLEVGTLGGYSTIWLARGVGSGGRVVTLEIDPLHAATAQRNFAAAGLSEVIDLRFGPALESLPQIAAEGGEPFDFVFIDADKPSNPAYLEWALKLTRPGAVIVVDNVVRGGRVADGQSSDSAIVGTRKLFEQVAKQGRLDATAVQTLGLKGHDGFLIGIVA